MRIIKYLLIGFLSFNLSANAQKKKAENTLLWEISGNGLAKPSYIFGTYHFADKGFIDTMKVVNEKLAVADAVVGELVMDKNLALKLIPFMMMKETTLDKLLTAVEYKQVADFLKKTAGYDIKMFNTMKPIAVQTLIVQYYAPKTFTKDNPAIDEYFQTYGKANGKTVLGLETAEDQAKALFGSPIERQKKMLLKSIKNPEKDKKESLKIYNYYITQNLKQLAKIFSKPQGFTPEEMDALLKNRNIKWIEKLPSLMQEQSLFIAVGAGHLVGKDGVIKGLQAKGYTVKPVATN
jgi:uncharacterized protein YbaP (TraB family)